MRTRRRKNRPAASDPPRSSVRRGAFVVARGKPISSAIDVAEAGSPQKSSKAHIVDDLDNMKIRRRLMAEISELVERRRLTQAAAGKLFGVAQPRISDVRRGKVELFTIDTLVNMLAHAGIRARVELEV